MVCNQKGKGMVIPLKRISFENGQQVKASALKNGLNVIYEAKNGKTYAVTV